MTPPLGRWRLLAPALLGWAVAAWAITVPGSGRWVWLASALLGVLSLGAALGAVYLSERGDRDGRHKRGWRAQWSLLSLSCAVLVLLGSQIDAREWRSADPSISNAASREESLEVQVTIESFAAEAEAPRGDGRRFWVRATLRGERGQIPALIWVDGEADKSWAPGARLNVSGHVERLPPGSSAAYGLTLSKAADAVPIAPAQFSFVEHAGRLANDLRLGLRDAALPVSGAELLPGFAVGDTSLVGEELRDRMMETSLTHLTAVSGANCALVTSSILWLSSRLGGGRRLRFTLAALALAGFVFVVGPDPSVQRAAVMATVVLASGFGGKRSHALPGLGAAVLVLLTIDPWQALQPGFALSVAATAGILLLVPALGGWLRRTLRLPQPLALPVAVALAAQIACGPFLLLLQPGLSAVGVLANVLAAPAAPLGTGLGLLAMLTLPLAEPVGMMLVKIGALFARWVAATAEVCGQLPFARLPWPEGWAGAVLLAAVQAAPLVALALYKGRLSGAKGLRANQRAPWQKSPRVPRAVRLGVTVLLASASGAFLGPTMIAPLTERARAPSDWSIVACDVGQGDAILLRDPGHRDRVMLVDTGDDAKLLSDCLRLFGVRRISLLVLTHDHADHVGALSVVAARSDAALVAPQPAQSSDSGQNSAGNRGRPLLRALEEHNIDYRVAVAGLTSIGDGIKWEVLAPRAGRRPPDANSASLVMRVEAGGISVLLLGDTGEDEHRALLAREPDLKVDVVKVAHHGSSDQDPRLLSAAQAAFGLVTVGANNSYGHPTKAALRALRRAGTVALRTDELGSIALSSNGADIRAWSARSPSDVGGDE